MASIKSQLPDAFPVYKRQRYTEENEPVCSGQTKTLCFYFLCTIGVIVLTVFYAATPEVAEITENNPSFSAYESFEKWDPSCKCSQTGAKYSDFASMNLRPDRPCDGMRWAFNLCQTESNTNPNGQLASDCSFTALEGDGRLAVTMCNITQNLINSQITIFDQTTVTSSILFSKSQMAAAVAANAQERKESVGLNMGASLGVFLAVTTINGPLFWGSGLSAYQVDTQQEFPGYYDDSNCFSGFGGSTCSPFSSLTTQLYTDSLARFQFLYDAVPYMTDAQVLLLPDNFFTPMNESKFANDTRYIEAIRAGLIPEAVVPTTVDFKTYYDLCKPSECRFVVTRNREAVDIVTIVFGLIGGVSTVAAFVVATCVPAILAKIYGKPAAGQQGGASSATSAKSGTSDGQKKKSKNGKKKGKKGKKKKKKKKKVDDDESDEDEDEDDEDGDDEDEGSDGDNDELEEAGGDDDGDDDDEDGLDLEDAAYIEMEGGLAPTTY